MHPYISEVLSKKGFLLKSNEWYDLTSAIDNEEAIFLEKLVKEFQPKNSLEIGCAEGVSSMVICNGLPAGATHTIVDPNQNTQWKGMGIENIEKCGFNNYRLVVDYSEFALPELLKAGNKYDFVFVDGWHTFDHVLLEFFYISRLLNIGGIVVFDDTALVPLNRVMRYISNYPNFEVIGSAGEFSASTKRIFLETIKSTLRFLSKPLGKKIQNELFNDGVIRTNESLKINGSITAFKKNAEDTRSWAWYESF